MRLNLSTSGNLISGLIAFVIYTVIAITTGQAAALRSPSGPPSG